MFGLSLTPEVPVKDSDVRSASLSRVVCGAQRGARAGRRREAPALTVGRRPDRPSASRTVGVVYSQTLVLRRTNPKDFYLFIYWCWCSCQKITFHFFTKLLISQIV